MLETHIQSLAQEDLLEKEMAIHFSILAWRIPWTEEPGGLQYMGSERIGQYLVTKPPEDFWLLNYNIFLYVSECLGNIIHYL